jgi:hypothetical protein
MARISFGLLLICVLLSACNNKPKSNGEQTSTNTATSASQLDTLMVINIPVLKDSAFNLAKLEVYFQYKNDLSKIPNDSSFGQASPPVILDSAAVKMIYQDSVNHYFPVEEYQGVVYGGVRFYGYLDTFKNFNVVCMYTGRGDGGDGYDLITFTKKGKRIAGMEAAWCQGEEDEWPSQQTAHVSGREIDIRETVCHWVNAPGNLACDTFRRIYEFKDDGEFIFVKRDSVLSPVLDSIRKAIR